MFLSRIRSSTEVAATLSRALASQSPGRMDEERRARVESVAHPHLLRTEARKGHHLAKRLCEEPSRELGLGVRMIAQAKDAAAVRHVCLELTVRVIATPERRDAHGD